ncbi:hypothetical protein KDW55_24120 [Burkholderia sp. AU19243]|uniref:hypothetical protein n=1 Tax=Burkholderia TaxID=32008 RepID=UPI001B9E4D01|nr:hypothetical protein [Burkholderia sp. AU19243]MBR8142670.1 hypothetical protein [Burkholderia vietnamiensis]MBR8366405.1 hypothetical protein [Burkholderia sp. AU19243]
MMDPILSNDDGDWHSHLERGVKESPLNWHSDLFVTGAACAAGAGAPHRIRKTPETLVRRAFADFPAGGFIAPRRVLPCGVKACRSTLRHREHSFPFRSEYAFLFSPPAQYRRERRWPGGLAQPPDRRASAHGTGAIGAAGARAGIPGRAPAPLRLRAHHVPKAGQPAAP